MDAYLDQATAPATMGDVIRRWAEIQPDAPAFVSEGQAPLTYRALSDAIDGIGKALNDSGFGRGDRVAVVHSGGPQLATTLYGVIATATVAPLKPTLTTDEFRAQIKARGINGLIVESALDTFAREAAAQLHLPVLEVSSADDRVTGLVRLHPSAGQHRRPAEPAQADDYAFILATSATTARSKIVPLRHRQLVRRAASMAELIGLRTDDRCLNLMPLLYGQSRVATVLYSGGSLAFMPVFEVEAFFRLLETLRPTWFQGSYTFQHMICHHAPKHRSVVQRSSLRLIRTTSGRLEPEITEQLEQMFGVRVIESYSSSEAGLIAGNGPVPDARGRGTAGRPAPGCEVAIVGTDGQSLPRGSEGEIVVRGPEVFDGYEGDPALNAAAFAEGWFRTGDLGYVDEDGFLRLIGRSKEMINRGGEKISPAEVDAVMIRHPVVAQGVTFPIPHPTLGELPAAAVVLTEGATLSENDLGRFLRERLAAFKVPRLFVFVDEIPRSDAGKIQRNRLADLLGVGMKGTGKPPR